MRIGTFLWLTLCLSLVGCGDQGEYRGETFLFGTTVSMQARGVKTDVADRAFADLTRRLEVYHREWHAWEPGDLVDINGSFAVGRATTASPEIIHMIKRAQAFEMRSRGMFNAAAGGLVEMWGFHTSDYPVYAPEPTLEEISAWLDAAPSMRDVTIKNDLVTSSNRAVQIDLGGIAKGYAVDLAMEVLESHGLENFLVNAGGDMRGRGKPDQAWKIGILNGAGAVIASVEITGDEAVFTSGVDQRYRADEAGRRPHVLDPRTGMPVSGLRSVTVIAKSGLLADAAATALLVAGPDEWDSIAGRLGIKEALVVTDEGQVLVTRDLDARLQWEGEVAASRQVVE